MQDSLRAVDDLLTLSEDEQSCWTALLAIRQLESVRVSQIHLLAEYHKQFSNTHWTINIMLNLALEQTHEAGVSIRTILDDLYRQLKALETTLSPLLRIQLHALSTETRLLLDTEQNLLHHMFDMLIPAPKHPVSRAGLTVIK